MPRKSSYLGSEKAFPFEGKVGHASEPDEVLSNSSPSGKYKFNIECEKDSAE